MRATTEGWFDMVEALVAICVCVAADSPNSQSAKRETAMDHKLADAWFAQRRRILDEKPQRDGSPEGKDRFAAAQSGNVPPPLIEHPLAVGAVGALSGGTFKLVHRIGKSEGRVAIQKPPKGRDAARVARGKQKKLPEVVVLLRGFDLSRVEDGQECTARGCFTVTKPETYTTSYGKPRTLFVIEPFDSSVAEKLFREAVRREAEKQVD
jgi:hypothetical protein